VTRSKSAIPTPLGVGDQREIKKTALTGEKEPLSVDVILREQLQDEQLRNLRDHLEKGKLIHRYKNDDFFV